MSALETTGQGAMNTLLEGDMTLNKSPNSGSEARNKVKESITKVRNAQQFINRIRDQMYEMKRMKERRKPILPGQVGDPLTSGIW